MLSLAVISSGWGGLGLSESSGWTVPRGLSCYRWVQLEEVPNTKSEAKTKTRYIYIYYRLIYSLFAYVYIYY